MTEGGKVYTMQGEMKLWKLVLLIFLTNSASAFFSESVLEVTQKQVHIEAEGDSARVEIITELYNPSEKEVVFRELEPLKQDVEIVDFFVGMEGKGHSILEGKERLEYLFTQAREQEEVSLLGWGADRYPTLFRSENIAIGGRHKIRTKKVFNVPVLQQDDFFVLEIFLSDSEPFKNTEIIFSLEEGGEHFHHSLGKEGRTDTSDGVSFLWEGAPQSQIQFFWSNLENAEIGVPFLGMEYRAQFVKPPQKDIQEVSILIDRSGSLGGLPWKRAKDWTEFLIEMFEEDVRIRIGFFADGIDWHDEEFQRNTFDFQKNFFGFLSGVAPVGKTDITKALMGVQHGWTVDPENRAVFLITDETTLGENSAVFLENEITESYIVLQFAENVENDLAFFSKISGGFPLKLFRSSPNLVEKEEFLKKLNSLNRSSIPHFHEGRLVEDMIVQSEKWEMKDVLPKFFLPQMRSDSFFFVGRTDGSSENKNVSAGHFVSRKWGGLRIAEILKKENRQTSDLDALLAIGRTFGIATKFFENDTARSELEENLSSVSKIELLKEVLKLEITPSRSPSKKGENQIRVKFLNGVPLYKVEKRDSSASVGMTKEERGEGSMWQQFNFPELVRAETHIKIAPFSEAQKELFVKFPEFVAEGFGLAEEVNFCTEFRCLSVLSGEREETKPSDRAFFKDYDAGHWAHGYIVRAVEEGLLEPELNGKLHPNRAIDRGEFAQMVVKVFSDRVRTLRVRTPDANFTDVHDQGYFEAVQILAERGVVKGYPDGTFRPLQSLTRAEGVKILLSLSGYVSDESLDTYPKSIFPDVTGWEKSWVGESVKRGMVRGYDDGTFRPHGKLTRAEALKLVFEMQK